VVIKVKPVGSIIVVFCHPANLTFEGNIVAGHTTIDPVYNEPNSWDICKMHRETRSPHCIDDLVKSFYQPDSWAIAAHGFSHMIDTLAGKTQQLILMESDPDMLTWLQEWK
jgi:hypothetical protein